MIIIEANIRYEFRVFSNHMEPRDLGEVLKAQELTDNIRVHIP